jgi:long-chain fatty acid transport protein
MRKYWTIALIFAMLLVLAPFAQSSGFLIYEHGAAAQAMAGAFVSIANNPTAVFHNPAGMIWLPGTQVSLGNTFIIPKGSLSLPNWPDPTNRSFKQANQTFYAPNFYLTHKFGSRVAVGIGVFAPYGLGTKWPAAYPLRYIGTSNDMQTIFVNPAVAILLTDNLSIGLGASYIHSKLSLNLVRLQEVGPYSFDVPASVDGIKGDAWALNAGVLYKTPGVSFGFTWRGNFDIKYKGTLALDLVNIPAPYKPYFPTSGNVQTTFKFPDIFTAGVSFNLTDALLLAFDAQYYTWNRYDKYTIDITYPAGYPPADPEVVTENWKNTWLFRCGLQYQLSDCFALRGGIAYDQTPQPADSMDPNLPDASRVALTLGFGYKIGKITIDVAGQYEKFNDRKSPNRMIYYVPAYGLNLGEGTYKTSGLLIGVSLGYAF